MAEQQQDAGEQAAPEGAELAGGEGTQEAPVVEENPEAAAVGDKAEGDEVRFDYGVHGKLTAKEAEQRMWMQPHFTKKMQEVSEREKALTQREEALKAKEAAAAGQQSGAVKLDLKATREKLDQFKDYPELAPVREIADHLMLQEQSQAEREKSIAAMEEGFNSMVEIMFDDQFERVTGEGGKYHGVTLDKEAVRQFMLNQPGGKLSRTMVADTIQRMLGSKYVAQIEKEGGKSKTLPRGTGAPAGKKLTPAEVAAKKFEEIDKQFSLGQWAKHKLGFV